MTTVLTASAVGQITGVDGVDMIARLTGPGAINDTVSFRIGGTDLGHMVVHRDKTFFLFGDTFSGETVEDGGFWRNNTMAWSTDPIPADGVFFDNWITDAAGRARQVIRSGYQNPITEIPTGAISVGDRLYAWFMSVNWWGPPGEWTLRYAGLAYSDDEGEHFTIVNGFRLPATTNFGMVAASTRTDLPAGSDEHIYVWGTPSGRLGGVKLARVLPANIENPAAYEYYGGLSNGLPFWTISESAAMKVVPATVGEMSVMYNPAARRWTMLYFDQTLYSIQLRQAREPWGPWSKGMTITDGYEYPGLYGSYMNPLYVENHGEQVYFTMSLWDPYDVYLMRARFTVNSPPCPADLNLDDRVNDGDIAMFMPCMSGADTAYSDVLACAPADLDRDGDIDQTDFGMLQTCMTKPYEPADPACAR